MPLLVRIVLNTACQLASTSYHGFLRALSPCESRVARVLIRLLAWYMTRGVARSSFVNHLLVRCGCILSVPMGRMRAEAAMTCCQ
jgi:hypothetical protein